VGARDSDIRKKALHDLKAGEFDFDVGDTARAGAQGLTFGFSDEIGAAVRAPFSDKKYSELRDESRFAMDRQRELHPWKTGGAELAGGLLTGGAGGMRAAGGMAARQGLKAMAGQGAKIGTGYGAAAGLGYGEGEGIGGMAKDTAIGAGVGAVASPLIMMGGMGLGKAGQAISARLPGGAKRRADAKINQILEDADINPTQVEDILKANPAMVLGDIGPLQQLGAKHATP